MTAAGHDGLTALGQWLSRLRQEDLARLRAPVDPLTRAYRIPNEKTIRSVLNRVDPQELRRALLGARRGAPKGSKGPRGSPSRHVRKYKARRAKALAKKRARSRLRAVAVDGKAARGARRSNGTRVHLLGICSHDGYFIDHLEVGAKHNETTHFTELLGPLHLGGQVVTFDALHTVRTNLDWLVTTKNAHYVAVVKKNQPLLCARVKSLPWKKIPTGTTTRESGHGRIETRTLKAAHVKDLDFPHACQAIKITRWRQNETTGKINRETVYVITSLTSAQATPEDLARLVREHWTIEVNHHIRDVSFSEDHSTSRTGHGPINLATIRNAIINAIHDIGYLYIPEGRRDHTTALEALYLHGLT